MKTKLDVYEQDVLDAYEKGKMKTLLTSKADVAKYRTAARDTFIKDRRINIKLSTPDLLDIQEKAAEEGVPYQTFIASVLHKYISGRLVETPSRLTPRSTGQMRRLKTG